MIRLLIYGLGILHLGPGFAFAMLTLGCEDGMPYSPLSFCTQESFAAFIQLTLAAWAVMVLGLTLIWAMRAALDKKRSARH